MSCISSCLGPGVFFTLNLVMFCLGLYLLTTGANILQLKDIQRFTSFRLPGEKFTKQLKLDMIPGVKILAGVGVFLGGWLMSTGFLGMAASMVGLKLLYMAFINLLVLSLLLWLCYVFAIKYLTYHAEEIHQVAQFTFEFGLRFNYWGSPNITTDFEKMVDAVQAELGCCGLDNYTEYRQFALIWLNNTDQEQVVPPSCCKLFTNVYLQNSTFLLTDDNCTRTPTAENSYIEQPCYSLMVTKIKANKVMFLRMAAGISVLLITMIALGVVLMVTGGGILG
ncbi:unnamed protein product [Candidula unifasciata]|uniref:Tetraspanin n=1 Tax=Candidula unifasciata TaxID=100452 RepID=A0A8S3YWA8_9EUPU|nr:unnamed protein product [Candidula unifasciata]